MRRSTLAVTHDAHHEFVPVEPFVFTLERGTVNEIWIEMNRRNGRAISFRGKDD